MKKIITVLLFSTLLLSTISLINMAKAADKLTATIIGSGSPIYNENRASASTLISAGNTHILVDMGNGTQANLNKATANININHLNTGVYIVEVLSANNKSIVKLIKK